MKFISLSVTAIACHADYLSAEFPVIAPTLCCASRNVNAHKGISGTYYRIGVSKSAYSVICSRNSSNDCQHPVHGLISPPAAWQGTAYRARMKRNDYAHAGEWHGRLMVWKQMAPARESPVMHSAEHVSYGSLFRFFIPLAIQAASQSFTYPLVASIASHGAGGPLNLAGMDQAMIMMSMLGMLGAGLVTTGMVHGVTKAGYARFRQVNWVFTGIVLAMMALLCIPPLAHFWLGRVLGLPASIEHPCLPGLCRIAAAAALVFPPQSVSGLPVYLWRHHAGQRRDHHAYCGHPLARARLHQRGTGRPELGGGGAGGGRQLRSPPLLVLCPAVYPQAAARYRGDRHPRRR